MNKKGMLPDWVYYLLCTVVTLLALWVGTEVTGMAADQRRYEAKFRAEYVPASIIADKMFAIQKRALTDPNYNPDSYIRDVGQLYALGAHSEASSTGDSIREHLRDYLDKVELAKPEIQVQLASVPANMRTPTLHNLLGPQLMLAQRKYAPKDGVNFGAIGAFLWQIVLMGLFFSFGAFGILLLRLIRDSRCLAQVIVTIQADWLTILGSSFIWLSGLSPEGYNPANRWQERIRQMTPWSKAVDYDTQLQASELELLGKGEAILAAWRSIWTGISWRQLIPDLRLSQLRTTTGRRKAVGQLRLARQQASGALYLSLMATIYITFGYAQAVQADEKKEAPDWLSGTTLVSTIDPRVPSDMSDHLFIFGKRGTTAILLGFTGPDPQLEISQALWRIKRKNFYFEAGPFVDLASQGEEPVRALGITSFFSYHWKKLTLAGPLYFESNPDGQKGIWMPGTVALYQLTKRWAAGYGFSYFAADGAQSAFTGGPLVQYGINDNSLLRVRYTDGGTGFFKDSGPRLRFDWILRTK